MAEKIIAASLQVDTGDSNKQIKEVKDNLTGVKDELKSTDQQAGKTSETITQTSGSFGKLKEQLLNIPGPVGQAAQGVQGLGTAFKALLANPVVLVLTAIVGALALLYKAFTSTNDGADKMEQIMAGIGSAIDVLRDRVLKAAGAIAKFFSGDFKGAMSDARAAVSGIGDEIAAEFNKAADAVRRLQEVEDATRALGVSRAKLNRDLAATKELISDENASYEQKKKALEQVRVIEGKQTEQELENAKKKLQAIRDRNALSDTSDEDMQKEADAQAELYRLEEESAKNIRSLNKQSRAIESEARAKDKAAREQSIAEQKEAAQKLAEFNNRLLQLKQSNELATIEDGYKKELRALEIKGENEHAAIEQQVKDQRLTRQQASQLLAELTAQQQLEQQDIIDKQNEEVKQKEIEFQAELSKLRQETSLKGITDTRELERVQLSIGYEERLNEAITRYKDDAAKLSEVQKEISEQQRLDSLALEEKFKQEDEERKLAEAEKAAEETANDPTQSFEVRQAALDQEQAAFQAAFDAKVITEQQYNEKVRALTEARKSLATEEANQRMATFGAIGNAFESLSNLIGKKTAAGKALAVASATISAIQSAVSSFNSLAPIPIVGPALGAVAAAAAIASGIANVKKIVAVKVPGESGGGGSIPSVSTPAAPLAPTTQSTKIDASSIQDIGNAQSGKAIKTFVVDSDTGNARDRQARLERAAILGG